MIVWKDSKRTLYRWYGPDRLLANRCQIELCMLEGMTRRVLERVRPELMRPGHTMWHLTRNINAVLASGLSPRKPKLIENPRGVYLFDNRKLALKARGEYTDPTSLALLVIDVGGLELRRDRMIRHHAWYSKEAIALERINHEILLP